MVVVWDQLSQQFYMVDLMYVKAKSHIYKGREGKRKKGKNPFYISFINILELRGFGFGFGDGKFI